MHEESIVPSLVGVTLKLRLQEPQDAPGRMEEAAAPEPDGLLLMQCSSPSRAATNTSQDSQASMEHAEKITPEHKLSQPAKANLKVEFKSIRLLVWR